ncbi:ATP-binding protein [Marinobacterium sp. BA1]|uniref:ATP-binding protein n=1 Tax=Marinobacterium sp. BA1 TaxID=3138931 RepID=UPI0032E63069
MPGTRSRLSIRHRVLLLSIIPMLVLATILGSYFIYSRLSDNTDKLIERGKIMVDLLASAAEFGVISGNQYQLRVLSQKTRYSHAEVLDVLFYDDTFNLLHRSGQFAVELSAESPALQSTSGQWIFLSPIFSSALLADNNPKLSIHAPEPEQIGWVAVVLSAHNNIATRQEMLRNSLLLISLGLMLTAILASRFGRRITQPIRGLSQVVERLEAGHLDTRAATTHTAGELGLLARGINRMAARIQASSQEQEQQINRATRQLTSTLRHLERQNEELTVARRQADKANRSKDEFLARMSHELRTPLTSVLGFSRLLEQTEQSAEQRHYCSIINQTSSLLLTIIDDILDFSRLQSDAIQLEQIPFDPTLYFNNLLQMQAPMALEKGLQLRSELDPELPPALLGDPTRIGQILTNLLSNAIKFTDHGEVCFRVRSQRQDSICHIELSVQDTGIGISEQQQQHLFKAFIQADNTISRRFGGSGLGLVIAHRLTLLMGGTSDSAVKRARVPVLT